MKSTYRIRIERIETVPEQSSKWLSNAKPDGLSGYVESPTGMTKDITTQVYDQTVEKLDLGALVIFINTPAP